MKIIIIVKKDGSKWPIKSWTKKRLNLTHMHDMKAHVFDDAAGQATYEAMQAKLQQNPDAKSETANVEIMDFEVYKREALHHFPVLKVKEGSTTAEKFGFEQFHHLHCFGDIICAVVWDTREVQKVIKVDDLTDEDINNLVFFENDNYKRLKFQSETDFLTAKPELMHDSKLFTLGLIQKIIGC